MTLPSYAKWICDICWEYLYKRDSHDDCFYCQQKELVKKHKTQDTVTDRRRRKKFDKYLISRK